MKADDKSKIDYGETVRGKNLSNIKGMNNDIVKNMGGFTEMQRDALNKLNSERSNYSAAKDKLDKFNDVDSMFKKMLESTDNQEQRGAITRAQNLLHAGKLGTDDSMNAVLKEIGDIKGTGTIDASTFGQMKDMTLKAHENASNSGALDMDVDTLKKDKEKAEKDYNDQQSKVKTVEENIGDESVKAAFKAVSDTIDKSISALEERQRREDIQNINSAIIYSPTNNESISQNSSTQQSSSNQANGTTEPSQTGTTQVGNGGTVQADIDTSRLEQKLDEINTSVQTGSKNVANQVRTSGEKINSNLRTTNETLGKMNTGIENINDALGDIKKATKDTNNKMDQNE